MTRAGTAPGRATEGRRDGASDAHICWTVGYVPSCVVRLNEARYDRQAFVKRGIEHVDLFFNDCTVPPPSIVLRFLEIVERTSGVLCVAQIHLQQTHACMQTR